MKFLVIGGGSIGKRHIKNLETIEAGEIFACDTSPERCRNIEQEFGVKTFTELETALEQKPNAALICVPTSLHLTAALAAAEKGCHLFIEKPLSHDLDGVDKLVETVKQKKLVSLVGCNMRFHPGVALMKKLLDKKSIGKVICARVQAGQYLPDWHPLEDYRKGYSASKALGGGIILDGIHEIDYIAWLMGNACRVGCFAGKISSLEIDTEDTAEILLGFESGAIAEVHLDYIQRAYARTCQIIGEEGTISWDMSEKQVKLYTADSKIWQVFPQAADYDINQMYIDEMKHFIACLKGQNKPLQDINSGRKALQIAIAAKQAAESGKTIKLEDI